MALNEPLGHLEVSVEAIWVLSEPRGHELSSYRAQQHVLLIEVSHDAVWALNKPLGHDLGGSGPEKMYF